MTISQKYFYITAKIDDQERFLKVIELETSDGVPYYSCLLGEKEITQIRKERYGKWEQLWGDLDMNSVNNIGEKILEKTTPP